MNISLNILELPPEILEIIFQKLSSINDIISCYKTCKRWKNQVETMFKDKRKYHFIGPIPYIPSKILAITPTDFVI